MTTLFSIDGDRLEPLGASSLASESQLESWIEADPSIVGLDVLILGRQIVTDFGGRIDLLAIDSSGNLTVMELKRDRTPRDVVAQLLDYAAWVRTLTTREVHEIASRALGQPLTDAFRERFGAPVPEVLNANHSLLVVASDLDPASRRIVEYLAEEYGANINTAFFRVFERDGDQFLTTDWLLDQQEVEDRSETRQKAPWTGLWYANIGEGPTRSWQDMTTHGFLAAGGGRRYSAPLRNLRVGDSLYAYHIGHGYCGYGVVSGESVMARDFQVEGSPLLHLDLTQPNLGHDQDDPELAEYVVGVNWLKTFPLSAPQTFRGAFANQDIVCKLRHAQTIDFLQETFHTAN